MTDATVSPRWNLFARELEDILAVHGRCLGQLDDRTGIHREKVRRLRRSLEQPRSFPTLNPEEMDRVVDTFALSDDEVLHLRAAILATSVEALLMDRINQDDALRAAEQIFPVILAALREQQDGTNGMSAIRGRGVIIFEETDTDVALAAALEAIDCATLALHLSRHVAAQRERIERARQAQEGFTVALAELAEAPDAVCGTAAWHAWRDEAQGGLAAARERLAELGVAG